MSRDSEASKALRSPLANARGRGIAREGAHHWWLERVTSLILIPLCLWFLATLLSGMVTLDAEGIADWLSRPIPALLMIVLLFVSFLHGKMGMQVVIEDYVHAEGTKLVCILLNNAVFWSAGLLALMAVVKLHFLS